MRDVQAAIAARVPSQARALGRDVEGLRCFAAAVGPGTAQLGFDPAAFDLWALGQ